jgi:hypothetical protein
MGFLDAPVGAAGVFRVRAAELAPPDLLPGGHDGLPRTAGAFLTDTADEATYLTCPHPSCRRRHGPYTARGFWRRLRSGQPLAT